MLIRLVPAFGRRRFNVAAHYEDGSICVFFRNEWRAWWFPFINFECIRTEILRSDGTWTTPVHAWETADPRTGLNVFGGKPKEPDGHLVEEHAYSYMLRNGQVQNVIASCSLLKYTMRRKWLTWLPLGGRAVLTMAVGFSDEVEERTGSWGGCMGCSEILRPGETMESALRRMEAERRFT